MAKFTDLPPEVILQIMCESWYIRHVLRLSATCSLTQHIWRDHAPVITCAVFSFSRADFLELLQCARLEASSSSDQALHKEVLEKDLNAAVRQHLRFLASIY
jgi:hypothetical protein